MSQQYSVEQVPEQGETVQIVQQGRQVAVILSTAEYDRLLHKKQGFWESVERFRQEHNVEAADIDPDEVFKDVREHSNVSDYADFQDLQVENRFA